jgi:hypothetical protein
VDDCGAVVGGADVADIGVTKLVCAEAGQQAGEDYREIALGPVGLAL